MSGKAHDLGVAVRACVRCGLSIGESATFCPVCGASCEPAAATAVEQTAVAPEAPGPAEAEESAAGARDRRLRELSDQLQAAAGCEEADPARAAGLWQEVILGCLDVPEHPLGDEEVRDRLLEGFDRLSALLEGQGLADEALALVDEAALLGLLDHQGAADGRRDALCDRREGLRRILFVDSAQL